MSEESKSVKMGCGTVIILIIIGIVFLGQLGSSLTVGGQ